MYHVRAPHMTRKRLIFKKIPEENTLSASNEKDFALIDVTPLCRRIHLIINLFLPSTLYSL